ncbi:MFS transporter [Ideonella benzenivorans]|uniref:MFS transporter n=1 Tax=Ideonella benzenivorans TaxID=2831643 RepID=UPI001CEC70D8|nr:MFS transporter [Ideonella benzenivorans]
MLSWTPFARVCFAMCVGVMGTALASPLYPLYQDRWQLQAGDITHIFTVYMGGVLVSLLFLARLTHRVGYLPVLRGALVLVTAGVLLSAVAWNPASFVLSRLAIGLASGLITTSASIGLSQLGQPGDGRRTAALTTFAMTLGFGLGPLVGGVIAQWLPAPLHSAYLPSLLLGGLAWLALRPLAAPQATSAALPPMRAADWLPRVMLPAPAVRRYFWIGGLSAFTAFGMFSLYASLAPSFMRELLPWHGPAISGLSIAMILFLSSAFQLMARRLSTKACAVGGLATLALCNLLLILTARTGALSLFVLSVLVTSFGHGLANVTGMSVVNKVANTDTRPGLLSSYLIVGYLGTILPILAMGALSDRLGLSQALVIFCTAMALLSAVLAAAAQRLPPLPLPRSA